VRGVVAVVLSSRRTPGIGRREKEKKRKREIFLGKIKGTSFFFFVDHIVLPFSARAWTMRGSHISDITK